MYINNKSYLTRSLFLCANFLISSNYTVNELLINTQMIDFSYNEKLKYIVSAFLSKINVSLDRSRTQAMAI